MVDANKLILCLDHRVWNPDGHNSLFWKSALNISELPQEEGGWLDQLSSSTTLNHPTDFSLRNCSHGCSRNSTSKQNCLIKIHVFHDRYSTYSLKITSDKSLTVSSNVKSTWKGHDVPLAAHLGSCVRVHDVWLCTLQTRTLLFFFGRRCSEHTPLQLNCQLTTTGDALLTASAPSCMKIGLLRNSSTIWHIQWSLFRFLFSPVWQWEKNIDVMISLSKEMESRCGQPIVA